MIHEMRDERGRTAVTFSPLVRLWPALLWVLPGVWNSRVSAPDQFFHRSALLPPVRLLIFLE